MQNDRPFEDGRIDEEENDDDEDFGDLSEGMIVPLTPVPKHIQKMGRVDNIEKDQKSSNISAAHTRTNSSKAQSLRGSVHISKPLGSHFSSIASVQGQSKLEKIDKTLLNKFLRETFSGALPSENPIHLLKSGGSLKKANELNDDVQ